MSTDDEPSDTFILADEQEQAPRSFKKHRRINVLKSFLHHKRVAFFSVLLVVAIAEPILYVRAVRPVFRSESLLVVAPVMLKNVIEDRQYEVPRFDELVNEQIALVIREEVSLDALSKLQAEGGGWVRPGESRRDAAARLSQALLVKRVPDSTYISIALEANDPQGLAPVVNAVTDAYLLRVKGRGFYGQEVREETLHQRRAELQEEIRKKTEQLSLWAKDLGVFEKPAEGGAPQSIDSKILADARARLAESESRLGSVKVRSEVFRQADLTAEARELSAKDAELVSLKAILLPRKNELKAKSLGLTDQHQGRKELLRMMAEIDQDLERSEKLAFERARIELAQKRDQKVKDDVQLAESELEAARIFEKTLGEQNQAKAEKIAKFNSLYYEAATVRADVERLNRQLGALEDRLDAMRLEAQTPGFVTLVSAARHPDKPIHRPIATLIIAFIGMAIFLAFAIPTALDVLDHRIQSPIDVEPVIDARPLGWVLERSPRADKFVDDQLRRIALSLERQRRIHQRGQIAVMSLRPGGGTTQLVLDLARELRAIGSRTIVVEANALHPDGRYQAPKGHAGLVGALGGQIRIEEVILPPRGFLTYRIPLGSTEGEPLIPNSRNLRQVFNHLSSNHDMVLIDAPPLFFSSDAELIASCAQGVILVVEAGKVVSGEVKRAMDIVREIGPLMIEVVVNRVRDFRGHGYYSELVEQYESVGRPRPSA
jgi:Mrp family chromosome partitioning ATPase/uncharacterized protein involved in exopolysaccharide biosynthesis